MHGHRERRELSCSLDEARDVGGGGGIADHMRDPGAISGEFGGGRGELLGIAPGDRDGIAAGGKAARDRGAEAVGCADAGNQHAALHGGWVEGGSVVHGSLH